MDENGFTCLQTLDYLANDQGRCGVHLVYINYRLLPNWGEAIIINKLYLEMLPISSFSDLYDDSLGIAFGDGIDGILD